MVVNDGSGSRMHAYYIEADGSARLFSLASSRFGIALLLIPTYLHILNISLPVDVVVNDRNMLRLRN